MSVLDLVAESNIRAIPALGKPRTARLPSVAETTLPNGLRVLAVRRPGVPLVELRLRIPFAGKGDTHAAKAQLLGDTLLSGTEARSAERIAIDLQGLGGSLSASADSDRLAFGGSVLSRGLPGLLALLGEVLTSATYPKREVDGERDRLVQELAIYRSQPGVIAREALLHRMYGDHPYGRELPTAEAVEAVKAVALRTLHHKRVAPAGSVLVLVGDLSPARALASVEKALGDWDATSTAQEAPPLPAPPGGPALLVDRPGAVQTSIRLAGTAPHRTHPDQPAVTLANLVFGGYFSSRWVANIREDKGYTYSPHSGVEHPPAGSRLTLATDVATEVTAPALVETWYELGRLVSLPVSQAELDQARRYSIGSLALSTASQAGLASTLSVLAASGLGVEWLRDHPARLAAVTVDDVLEAAGRYFSPVSLTAVLVGDADRIGDAVARVLPLAR
ncbi:MAG: peptidase domain protein [Frankiales bacterium]|nr:peptidase domain protein [Frankiales bacterium]